MTISKQIERELNQLNVDAGNAHLSVDLGVGRLSCNFTKLDSIACSFETLSLSTDKLAGSSVEHLQKISEALSSRLSYLLEPISPIETDADGCTIQMRSNPPHKDDNGTSYYELLVRRGGELSLSRYVAQLGSQRQGVAADVTREVLCRLATDFVAVIE